MTQYVFANNVNTTLASALPSASTTIVLASSANLPTLSAGQIMPITLNDAATGLQYEICYVTSISGTSLTVTRAQEGTSALNWNVGDYAFCAFTSGTTAVSTGNPNNTFQVAAPTASNQAIPAGQAAGVVGSVRNLVMGVGTASATATMTADEIIVETALGGIRYCLSSFSKTINLATTGAGGMDTGTAPISGYVALYAIYNPTTQTAALLARNATSAIQPNIYGGANMPSGYTASALVSVWQTNGSGQFLVGNQYDRTISTTGVTILSTTVAASSYTSFTTTGVPMNAKTCRGYQSITGNTASVGMQSSVASSSTGIGAAGQSATMPTNSSSISTPFPAVQLITPQTLYYQATTSSGTLNYVVGIFEYTI